MTYRWTPEGPIFEFPSPFGTENRFRQLRGYTLIACALVLSLVLSFVGASQDEGPLLSLDEVVHDALLWPHVIAAALLAVLGIWDLVRESKQHTLQLLPGQPASLMFEVAREATGTGAGVPALQDLLTGRYAQATPLTGPYAGWLSRLGRDLPAAPNTLHVYLRLRMAHGVVLAGLLLLLACVALMALALPRPGALSLAALTLAGLASAVLVRHIVQPDQPAWGSWTMLALSLLALLVGAAPGWGLAELPGAARLERLGLPLAAAALMAGGVLIELLSIAAARVQLKAPRPAQVVADEASLGDEMDPDQLLRKLDLELHRRWAEGIPTRRYAWQSQLRDAGFSATVIEESQPLIAHDVAGHAAPRALFALNTVGLLLSVAGAFLWVWLAYAQMRDSSSSWAAASAGLVCLLLSVYALRNSHLLWSRVEVQSTLTWLEFEGGGQLAGAAGEGATAARPGSRIPQLRCRARVAQLRSVFYASAPHWVGSRVVLSVQALAAESHSWTGFVRALAGQQAVEPAPAPLPARSPARETRAPEAAPALARAPRFCSACGTPVLQGARFCQHCGQVLSG